MAIAANEISGAEVYVLESSSRLIVRPACVALRNGETLHVYNFTGGGLQIFIPKAEENAPRSIPVGGGKVAVKIKPDAGCEVFIGPVVYAVFCEKQGEFAEGESTPKIIIKP